MAYGKNGSMCWLAGAVLTLQKRVELLEAATNGAKCKDAEKFFFSFFFLFFFFFFFFLFFLFFAFFFFFNLDASIVRRSFLTFFFFLSVGRA